MEGGNAAAPEQAAPLQKTAPTQNPIFPPKPPPNVTAADVAAIFKREGHFDRLRKQLVQDFLDSRSSDDFYDRLDDILHRHLDHLIRRARNSYPPRPPWTSTQAAYEDSLREVQRHPLLERTLQDVDRRQFPRYMEGIEEMLLKIIDAERPAAEPAIKAEEQAPTQDVSPKMPSAITHSTAPLSTA